MAQPSATVDVAVEMPRACFDEKDHLNGRYFARRAQYLGELAAALRKKPSFMQVSWEFLGHDARCEAASSWAIHTTSGDWKNGLKLM